MASNPSDATAPRIIAIPTGDAAFSRMTSRLLKHGDATTPEAFEQRLRRLFPRAVVRARNLSGEMPSWYVYRDGGWRTSLIGPWWQAPGLPRIALTLDGWLAEADPFALGLLEIGPDDLGSRHFTDFVVRGALEDSLALLEIIGAGHELTATVLLRPASGHVLAVDLHGSRDADKLVAILRLADDVEAGPAASATDRPPIRCQPETDAAFRSYVEGALARMPEPTPDGLAIRLRRLYPHSEVSVDGDGWIARREPVSVLEEGPAWWTEAGLPWVRYDAEALIVAANEAALRLLNRDLVGHHWQEFVTPGSTEQVTAMLAILAEVGRAESRCRMSRADGSLVEFDSYTEVDGESYTTVMRARS